MTSTARACFTALSVGWLAAGCGDVDIAGIPADASADAASDAGIEGGGQAPFSVALAAPRLFVRQGETADVVVTIERDAGFEDAITVDLDRVPDGVTAEPLVFEGGATSATMTVSAAADSTQGAAEIDITASAGDSAIVAALRLLVAGPPGTLDQSFAKDGVLLFQLEGSSTRGEGIALQPDGKILVTGGVLGDILTLRFRDDGTLDDSFGEGGAALHGAGSSLARQVTTSGADRILVSGQADPVTDPDIALFAYTAAGERDTSFGVDGVALAETDTSSAAADHIAVQPDGAIVAFGRGSDSETGDPTLHVVRFSPSGAQDPSLSITQLGLSPRSGIVDADGRLLVAGSRLAGSQVDFFLARFRADGAPDLTFDTDGLAFLDFAAGSASNDVALAVLQQPDGKLLVAGSIDSTAPDAAGLARYNPDGTLDPTFGSDGRAIAATPIHAFAATFDAAGRIIILGRSEAGLRPAIARILPDSATDTTFGDSSLAIVDVFAPGSLSDPHFQSAAFDTDDRIVAVGTIGGGGQNFLVVSRLWP